MFAGNFAPAGWALCNGQLMPISQNPALFSLVGTFYGGDGKSTFGLPNLQGATPIHMGQGPNLTLRDLGDSGGEEKVTLLSSELPQHSHTAQAATSGGADSPAGNAWGEAKEGKTPLNVYTNNLASNVSMSPGALSITGGGLPHNNLAPYLVLTFVIALQGVFPARG